jgi:hypothetical protein
MYSEIAPHTGPQVNNSGQHEESASLATMRCLLLMLALTETKLSRSVRRHISHINNAWFDLQPIQNWK